MSSGSFGALVLGLALGSLATPAAAAPVAAAPAPAASPTPAAPAGTTEVTGAYHGYSSRWINVFTADHRQLRFEVDERSVPGWQKRFKFGDQITVTYRDLSSRHMPVAIGLRKANASPAKK